MPETILSAILGSLLTAGVIYMFKVRGDIRQDDFQIQVLNEDLRRWIADRSALRDQEIERVKEDHNEKGTLHSGGYPKSLSLVARGVLQEWRDRVTSARRSYGEIALREGFAHQVYRHIHIPRGLHEVRRTPPLGRLPKVRRLEEAEPLRLSEGSRKIIEIWRNPIPRLKGSPVWPEDPTKVEGEEWILAFEEQGKLELRDAA